MSKISLAEREKVEELAFADFTASFGKVVEADWVYGFRGDSDDSVELHFDPPARVRVVGTPPSDVAHWVDDWLDPYWNVVPADDEVRLAGVRSLWIFGPSYHETALRKRWSPGRR